MSVGTVWVHTEVVEGSVASITLEILAKAREISSDVVAIVGGDGNAVAAELGAHGATSVLATGDLGSALPGPSVAGAMAAAIARVEPDLVLTATESSDGYTGTVPEQIAELMGLPSVTFAKSIEMTDAGINVKRQTEAGYDDVSCPMPCLVSVTAGVVEPRYPSFKGIMAAKSKPVDLLTVADLGIDAGSVGWAGAGQEIIAVEVAPVRDSGEIIEDEGEAYQRIVEFLDELKVI